MGNVMTTKLNLTLGAIGLLAAGSVFGATTWVLNTGTVTVSSVSVTSTGWADTGTNANQSGGPLQLQPASSNVVLYSGGLGINNLDGCSFGSTCDVGDVQSTAPEHAIDNNQRYEMVLLSFSQAVNLTNVSFGWTGTSDYASQGGDSDYTVMAFQGAAGNQGLAAKTWSSLDSGWTLVGQYNDATDYENRSLNSVNSNGVANSSAGVYSSFWLIGAYNPLVGGNMNWSLGNDYLKLASVTGTVCATGSAQCGGTTTKVSEPGYLALLGIGLLGMMRIRKSSPKG